jgi:hypothetical protein
MERGLTHPQPFPLLRVDMDKIHHAGRKWGDITERTVAAELNLFSDQREGSGKECCDRFSNLFRNKVNFSGAKTRPD